MFTFCLVVLFYLLFANALLCCCLLLFMAWLAVANLNCWLLFIACCVVLCGYLFVEVIIVYDVV